MKRYFVAHANQPASASKLAPTAIQIHPYIFAPRTESPDQPSVARRSKVVKLTPHYEVPHADARAPPQTSGVPCVTQDDNLTSGSAES